MENCQVELITPFGRYGSFKWVKEIKKIIGGMIPCPQCKELFDDWNDRDDEVRCNGVCDGWWNKKVVVDYWLDEQKKRGMIQ